MGFDALLDRTWKAFWWARGAVFAIVAFTIVPKVTSLEKLEFLRGFHAAVLSWNEFAAFIGEFVGRIPFIPELSTLAVNTLAFVFAAAPLAVVSTLKEFRSRKAHNKRMMLESVITREKRDADLRLRIKSLNEELNSLAKENPKRIEINRKIKYLGQEIVNNKQERSTSCSIWDASSIILLALYFYFLNAHLTDALTEIQIRPFYAYSLVVFIAVFTLWMAVMLAIQMYQFPIFGRGFLHCIIFLVAMELLYVSNAPWFSSAINDFACARLERGANGCPEPIEDR